MPAANGNCPQDWYADGPYVGLKTFWSSGYQSADGTVTSGPRDFPLNGAYGQRVCLYLERTFTLLGYRASRPERSKLLQVATPPVITVPGTLTAEAAGASGAAVNYDVSAKDSSGGAVSATCTPPSGSMFPIGSTTVKCTASDSFRTVGAASFEVVVTHTAAPVLSVPSPVGVVAPDLSGAIVRYTASAVDAVDGAVTPTCTPPSGSKFAVGTTTVTCSARDSAGNSGAATFVVTVQLPPHVVPQISAIMTTPGSFRPLRSGPSITTRAGAGTLITYKLSDAATVSFSVQQAVGGRGRGNACLPETSARRNLPRCTRFVSLKGSFKQAGKKGKNSLRFSGRVANRTLKPGAYHLTATPTANGATGRAQSVHFRILR
jgi:hypothetical protein